MLCRYQRSYMAITLDRRCYPISEHRGNRNYDGQQRRYRPCSELHYQWPCEAHRLIISLRKEISDQQKRYHFYGVKHRIRFPTHSQSHRNEWNTKSLSNSREWHDIRPHCVPHRLWPHIVTQLLRLLFFSSYITNHYSSSSFILLHKKMINQRHSLRPYHKSDFKKSKF